MLESAQNGTNQITDHEIKEEVDTIMFEVSSNTLSSLDPILHPTGVQQAEVVENVKSLAIKALHNFSSPSSLLTTNTHKYLASKIKRRACLEFETLRRLNH